MVPPAGLAETVMPPSFSPCAEVMVPLSTASAALAGASIAAAPNTIALRRMVCVLFMAWPPVVLFRSAHRGRGGRWGNGSQIRDDGFDLGGLEMILEARHARRAVADDLAHHRLLAAGRVLRQFRTVERARQLRLGMTDAAGLIEQPHAQKLSVVEGLSATCLLGRRILRRKREQQ